MSNPKRSDLATIDDTAWGFCIPEIVDQIKRLAVSGAREFPHLNAEDLEQDLILWLAVRPEQQLSIDYIIRNCRNRIREWGQAAYEKAGREVSYEEHFGQKEDAA